MAMRTWLAALALIVLAAGVPAAYGTAWFDLRHLDVVQFCLLLSMTPLVAMALSGISVAPSRYVPHSSRGDLMGVFVGSVSFWMLLAGVLVTGLAVAM
jgi:hypothetical protein